MAKRLCVARRSSGSASPWPPCACLNQGRLRLAVATTPHCDLARVIIGISGFKRGGWWKRSDRFDWQRHPFTLVSIFSAGRSATADTDRRLCLFWIRDQELHQSLPQMLTKRFLSTLDYGIVSVSSNEVTVVAERPQILDLTAGGGWRIAQTRRVLAVGYHQDVYQGVRCRLRAGRSRQAGSTGRANT